jgi:hypothetical protein
MVLFNYTEEFSSYNIIILNWFRFVVLGNLCLYFFNRYFIYTNIYYSYDRKKILSTLYINYKLANISLINYYKKLKIFMSSN